MLCSLFVTLTCTGNTNVYPIETQNLHNSWRKEMLFIFLAHVFVKKHKCIYPYLRMTFRCFFGCLQVTKKGNKINKFRRVHSHWALSDSDSSTLNDQDYIYMCDTYFLTSLAIIISPRYQCEPTLNKPIKQNADIYLLLRYVWWPCL